MHQVCGEPQCQIQTLREGGRSSRPLDKGGGWSPQEVFSRLRASVLYKNKGGDLSPLLDPPLIRIQSNPFTTDT